MLIENRKDFTSYAEVCFKEFGDRVLHWTTINEINYHAAKMYSKSPYTVGHNLLLAHASAVKLYKEKYQVKQHGLIGIPVYTSLFIPETNAESDQIAANRVRDFETGW
ncbi:Cyanidin 3-O-glucoside 5-O-glucosyltransferase [Bienertia sinuspersici]